MAALASRLGGGVGWWLDQPFEDLEAWVRAVGELDRLLGREGR